MTAVETDRHLVPILEEVVSDLGGVTVVHADAMDLDWDEVLGAHPRWALVANLPYNVATPLVLDLLADVPAIERMLVMVQKEAGERLAADPGAAAYGIPSVKVAYRATARIVGKVGPSVFVPQPRVDSALVEIIRRPEPATDADPDLLMALVEKAFNQRRKMLRRSLAGLVTPEQFAEAGVDPQDRPERLGVEDFGRLARVLANATDP